MSLKEISNYVIKNNKTKTTIHKLNEVLGLSYVPI
jgi:hypothetical protein